MASLRWPVVDPLGGSSGQAALFDPDDLADHRVGSGAFAGLEFLHVRARRIINPLPPGDRLPFSHTVNVYRGCSHACTYCFARPTHTYLGLGTGEDFERRLVVKINAVEALRAELAARHWAGHHIAMGTSTDPYQRCEGKYHLTQGVVRVLSEAANPFSVLTKSPLILRDLDLLVGASQRTSVRVNLSIGTLDEQVWRLTEPGTPPPAQRVAAVRRLRDAGIDCGVLVAPILPGMSDGTDQLAAVIDACVEAGATSISAVPLHLRPGVREHYLAWLAQVRPDLVAGYEDRYQRAYLPAADRRRLAEQVRALVDAADARLRGGAPPRAAGARDPAPGGDRFAADSEKPAGTWDPADRTRLVTGDLARRLREQGIGDAAPAPPPPPPAQLAWPGD